MSFKSKVSQLWLTQEFVAYRPPQLYSNVAPGPAYDLFTISGAVFIVLMGGRATGAPGAAGTQLAVAINGVVATGAGDIGAPGIGNVVNVAMDGAAQTDSAVALLQTITSGATVKGVVAGEGAGIVGTFGVNTWTGDFFVVYKKLTPDALIVPA